MIERLRGSLGLLGRILTILLLMVTVEFCVSTLLYERASQFSVQDDEAHRLAEHLVIAHKLLAESPLGKRSAAAKDLTTDRYYIAWMPSLLPLSRADPELDRMRRQIITWEPGLASTDLHIHLTSPGRHSFLKGVLRLPDGTWMEFGMRGAVKSWDLSIGRILLALAPAVALMVIGGLLIRRTLRPLGTLAAAARRVGLGARASVPLVGTSEVRGLILAFNEMQDRIRQLMAERTQALAAVGHDLRTPIARLQLRADTIADAPLREAIGSDLAEMAAMVTSLLAFLNGERDTEDLVCTDVAVLVETLVDAGSDIGWSIAYEGPQHLEALIRPLGLKRALGNLMENASHFGKTIHVVLAVENKRIVISIEDDGPGIPEDRMADVLNPFTRIDPARARNTTGLGLGLAIVTQAVKRDDGTFELRNRAEGGLRASIGLPYRIAQQ